MRSREGLLRLLDPKVPLNRSQVGDICAYLDSMEVTLGV